MILYLFFNERNLPLAYELQFYLPYMKVLKFLVFFLFFSHLAFADDCELLSAIDESSGKFCCKVGGNVQRTCPVTTTESCQFQSSPGTIRHCTLSLSTEEHLLDQLSSQMSSMHASTQKALTSPEHDCQENNPRTEVRGDPMPNSNEEDKLDYSVNLMWVNHSSDPFFKYLYPTASEAILKEKFLTHLVSWAEANPQGIMNLWYDSQMARKDALENTQAVLKKEFPAISKRIHFKDLRTFPEVMENPEVFSDKTPVYFRVDLLRVIAAYHTLKNAQELGMKHHFVYADIDVTPLSKEALFDPKTKHKLDEFGIVMAHGGLNQYQFENSFQMFASNKPNLLKAMKAALIDINIVRANYILKGGYWAYKKPGDTLPLQQTVYSSYDAMFHTYYHLQGWGVAKQYNENKPVDFNQSLENIFGHQTANTLSFESTSPKVQVKKAQFDSSGRIRHVNKLKIPRKMIDAPPSRFGGRPTQWNPNKISIKNFKQKLEQSLQDPSSFDNSFLFLAARNNDIESTTLIADRLSPQQLAQAAFTPSPQFDRMEKTTSFTAALKEGNPEIIGLILEKLSGYPDLLKKAVENAVEPSNYQNKSALHLMAKKGDLRSTKALFKAFSHDETLLKKLVDGLAGEGASGHPPIVEAAQAGCEANRRELIQFIFDQTADHPELRKQLENSFLKTDFNQHSGVQSLLNETSTETLQTLRKTFLKDSQLVARAFLMEDVGQETLLPYAIQRHRFQELEILAGDLLSDQNFMSQWSEKLTRQNRFRFNIFHYAARNGDAKGIRYLEKLFAAYPETLTSALQAQDDRRKTALDLAANEETKIAIQQVRASR